VRLGGGFGSGGAAELGEDVGDVHAGRFRRDEQRAGDLAVGLARCDETEHFELAAGQAEAVTTGLSVAGPAGEIGDLLRQRAGAEALRNRRGAAQPGRGRLASGSGRGGQRDHGGADQRDGDLVWLVDGLPGRDGLVRGGQPTVEGVGGGVGVGGVRVRVGGVRVSLRIDHRVRQLPGSLYRA